MYNLYGSKNTALVKPKDNPKQLVVWNRDFAIDRRQKQINDKKNRDARSNEGD